MNRKGGEVTPNLPIILRAETVEQQKNWLNEFYNCRQLTRDELADEPEFTIVEDENSNKDALCRKSSTERAAKLQKADSKLSTSDSKKDVEANDEQINVVRLNEGKPSEQKKDNSKDDSMTLDRIEKSESMQDSQINKPPANSNLSRRNSNENNPKQNSIRIEETEPDENNVKQKDEIYKRQSSRDLPEGLPKSPSDQQPQKMNSFSRQSTQQELNRNLSVNSVIDGERTPETNVSRQNSTNADKPNSRLSSRKSSVNNKIPSNDDIINRLADKSAAANENQQPSSTNLSRKSSTKETDQNEKQSQSKLSREGSRRSSVKRQDSRVVEEFQVFEESVKVPMTNESTSKSNSRRPSVDKPKFKKELQNVTVNSNETIVLECELEPCKDQLTLEWLKDNKVLNIAGRYKSSNQDNLYTLQINKAIVRDSGQFAFTATSPYSQTISSCKVTVKPPERQNSRPQTPDAQPSAPVFKIKLKDTELKEGSTVRFELLVNALPIATLKFFKDDKPLKENDRVKIEYTSDESCEILIENCKKEDAGRYKVQATNSLGQDNTECNVTISSDKDVFKGLPPDQPQLNSPRSASPTSEKQNLSASRVNSNPGSRPRTPAFKWFKDGSEFDANERFLCQFNEEEDTIGLVFQHVSPEDAGLYTCVAKTQGGKISCSAELTVEGEVNRLLRDPEPPRFKSPLVDSTVNQGSTATIEVSDFFID